MSNPQRKPARIIGNVVPMPLSAATKSAPKPPKHFEPPEAALWTSILASYQIDDDAGLMLLTSALEAHARMRRCRAKIDKDGEAVEDRFGQLRAHPLISAERGAKDSFAKVMRILNLDISKANSR